MLHRHVVSGRFIKAVCGALLLLLPAAPCRAAYQTGASGSDPLIIFDDFENTPDTGGPPNPGGGYSVGQSPVDSGPWTGTTGTTGSNNTQIVTDTHNGLYVNIRNGQNEGQAAQLTATLSGVTTMRYLDSYRSTACDYYYDFDVKPGLDATDRHTYNPQKYLAIGDSNGFLQVANIGFTDSHDPTNPNRLFVTAGGTTTYYGSAADGSRFVKVNLFLHTTGSQSWQYTLWVDDQRVTSSPVSFSSSGAKANVAEFRLSWQDSAVTLLDNFNWRADRFARPVSMGTWYNDSYPNHLVDPPVTARLDPTVDLDSVPGVLPPSGVNGTFYSTRWEGQVETDASGTYYFRTDTDDGSRLYVNDMSTPLIDNWVSPTQGWKTGSISLGAYQKYNIKLEYFQGQQGSKMRLQWQPPGAAGYTSVPMSNIYSPQLLANTGFEGTYSGGIAPSWGQLKIWGSPWPTRTPSQATGHSGSAAQKLAINNIIPGNNGYVFGQKFNAIRGHTYEVSAWIKTDATVAPCEFYMRAESEGTPMYAARGATKSLSSANVDGTWRKFTIRGGFDNDLTTSSNQAFFAFQFADTAIPSTGSYTLIIDDASVTDTTASVAAYGPADTTTSVPSTFFGMHVNKYRKYENGGYDSYPWPTYCNNGMVRLWDTLTRWKDVETSRGVYSLTHLDELVNAAYAANPSGQFILTLGQTPGWARAADNDPTKPPDNMQDWTDYVTHLVTQYDGNHSPHKRIKYWEIWNEADGSGFYTGTTAQLADMTQRAAGAIHAVSGNVVIAPNFTTIGLRKFDQFLSDPTYPPANYCDVFAYHAYATGGAAPDLKPEGSIPVQRAYLDRLADRAISKPLWNTESAVYGGSSGNDSPQKAAVSRLFIVPWVFGAKNLSWYAWDINYTTPDTHSQVALSTKTNHYNDYTVEATAYLATRNWLVDAQVVGKTMLPETGTWVIDLKRPANASYQGHILWNVNGAGTFSFPSWWAGMTRKRLLDNQTYTFSGTSLTLGTEPVLLENVAP